MERLIRDCELDCPDEKQIQVVEKCLKLVRIDCDKKRKSLGWLLLARILERCSPQCLRATQSRMGKKLVDIKSEPTIQGGIFLRQLLLRNPKIGNLYADVILSIITHFIDMTLTSDNLTLRRLCTELYSIRYGCDPQMTEILLNTLSTAIANKLLSPEERAEVLNLKSLGVSSMRVNLCNILFELYSSSLSYAKQGQFVLRDAIINILEISFDDLQLQDAVLATIRSLCTNGRNSFLPLVPQVVTMLLSKLGAPSDALFCTLDHICQVYGPGSTLFRHFHAIYSSLDHPLDQKVYGMSAGRLLSTVIQTSGFLVRPEVLMTIQRKVCEEVVQNTNSLIYRDILISFLSCTHELVPPPIHIARTVIRQCSDTTNLQLLSNLCDIISRPRIQNLVCYEDLRRSLAKIDRDTDTDDANINKSKAFNVSAIGTTVEESLQNPNEPVEQIDVAEPRSISTEFDLTKQDVLAGTSTSHESRFSTASLEVCETNSNVLVQESSFLSNKNNDVHNEAISETSRCYDKPVTELTESQQEKFRNVLEGNGLMDGEPSVEEILSTFCPD